MQLNVRTTISVAEKRDTQKENYMQDVNKEQSENPGPSGQQPGQPQQKHDDPSKKPTQDRNQEQGDYQKQQDQGGQRRAS